jgi:hypothetical protein
MQIYQAMSWITMNWGLLSPLILVGKVGWFIVQVSRCNPHARPLANCMCRVPEQHPFIVMSNSYFLLSTIALEPCSPSLDCGSGILVGGYRGLLAQVF